LEVADLDADGIVDLIVTGAAATLRVIAGDGAGSFAAQADYATGTGPTSTDIADFNGDGLLDVVVANGGDNTVSVFLAACVR
jgi:hypothetical protein